MINKIESDLLDFYDEEITKYISEKYGYSKLDSLRKFLNSKTYKMLINPELEMLEFSPLAILDMWENEKITGKPQNSGYLRSESYE